MEEVQKQLEKTEHAMQNACAHTQAAFAKIRTGRAVPSMLDHIQITHYGNLIPIQQVAVIGNLGARTLTIKPWEQRLIPEIEKVILNSKLGLTPQNDGKTICIHIPSLTEERRRELVKQVKREAERGRVAVRNARKALKETLKQMQKAGTAGDVVKRAEEQGQKLTDNYITKLDTLLASKDTELMEM